MVRFSHYSTEIYFIKKFKTASWAIVTTSFVRRKTVRFPQVQGMSHITHTVWLILLVSFIVHFELDGSIYPKVFHDVFLKRFLMKLKATKLSYHLSNTKLNRNKKWNANLEDFGDLFYFWILSRENTMESIFESGKYRKVIMIFRYYLMGE